MTRILLLALAAGCSKHAPPTAAAEPAPAAEPARPAGETVTSRLEAASLAFEVANERHNFARSSAYDHVEALSWDVELDEERDGRLVAIWLSDAGEEEAAKAVMQAQFDQFKEFFGLEGGWLPAEGGLLFHTYKGEEAEVGEAMRKAVEGIVLAKEASPPDEALTTAELPVDDVDALWADLVAGAGMLNAEADEGGQWLYFPAAACTVKRGEGKMVSCHNASKTCPDFLNQLLTYAEKEPIDFGG